ncbi:MAG: hypothetical protein U0Q11_00185 [Vicinamibacterales bacterium]
MLTISAPAFAEPEDEGSHIERKSWAAALWGTPQRSTLYPGMWTRHLHHGGVDNNQAVALGYRGYFAGTFVNSYHRRSYAVGFERSLHRREVAKDVTLGLGYRLGAIRGYDGRLLPVAGKVPVVPFAQAVGDVSWKRVGVEGTFCVRVVTAGFFIRL